MKSTIGSVKKVIIDGDKIKIAIKPASGYSVAFEDNYYILFVETVAGNPPQCSINEASQDFVLENHVAYAGIISYWQDKKALLKFTLKSPYTITTIEPYDEQK